MISRLSLCGWLAASLAAGQVHADAVTDFKNGSSVYIHHSKVHVGPIPQGRTGTRVPKPAGALSFTVNASDLGVDLPIELRLNGTDLGGGLIEFTFDDAYSNVDVTGNGSMLLTRVKGKIKARVSAMPGADAPICKGIICAGNVYFSVVSGAATAYGTWGTTTMTIDEARGVGGVPRPRLDQLSPPPPIKNSQGTYSLPLCSSSTPSVAAFGLWLGSPAPAGGARVDVTAKSSGVQSPGALVLDAGKRSAVFDLKIPANFAGTLRVTAAGGGSVKNRDVTVRPAAECAAPPSRPAYERYVPPTLGATGAVSTFVDINGQVDQLTAVNGQLRVIRDGVTYLLTTMFPNATSIDAEAINDLGWIAGRMTISGVNQAYRADTMHGTYELLGQMTPLEIDHSGVAFGYRIDGSTGMSRAAYSNGSGIFELPITSSFGVKASRALHVADTGHVVGTFTDSSGVLRGFRWANGTTTTLGMVGTKPAIPVAINRANQIAANGDSAVIIYSSGLTMQLGTPSGFADFRVTSLNRWGYAVGVATTTGMLTIQRAFAWIPGRGFVALSGYASGLSVADNALRITDANQIVVHGTANGVTDLYLLTL